MRKRLKMGIINEKANAVKPLIIKKFPASLPKK